MGVFLGAVAAAHLRLLNVMRVGAGVVVFTIFVLIVVDVFVRLVGLKPWLYSSILVEYGLLWFTMLAAPWLARTKGHVFIDAITQLLPSRAKRFFAKLAYLICICSCFMFAFHSLQLVIEAVVEGQIDTRAEDMPLWTLLLPIPVCFLLVGIEFIRYLIGFDSMYGDRTDVREGA